MQTSRAENRSSAPNVVSNVLSKKSGSFDEAKTWAHVRTVLGATTMPVPRNWFLAARRKNGTIDRRYEFIVSATSQGPDGQGCAQTCLKSPRKNDLPITCVIL